MNATAITEEDPRDWLALLQQRQHQFLSQRTKTAFDFLVRARSSPAGWGEFEGSPPKLHHTSLAVAALARSDTTDFRHLVKDTAVLYHKQYRAETRFPGRSLDLMSLFRILGCDPQRDHAVLARIQDELVARCRGGEDGKPVPVRTKMLAQVILVIAEYRGPEHVPEWLASRLVARQDSETNAWRTEDGGAVAVVPTALATLALSRLNDDAGRNCARRAYPYLASLSTKPDWEDDASASDPYAMAILVRALASVPGGDYEVLAAGVDRLCELRNPEGAWGATRGGPSSVEKSALSLLALFEAGEHRFVTLRLAREAVSDVLSHAVRISERLGKREAAVEELAHQICGQVQDQLEELQTERRADADRIDRLTAERRRLQVELERRRYSAYDAELDPGLARLRRIRSRRWRLLYFFSQAAIVIGGVVAILFDISSTVGPWVTGLLGLMFAGIVSAVLYSMERRVSVLGPDRSVSLRTLGDLRREFARMTVTWSPAGTQEFLYLFHRELLRLPPEFFRRRAEEFLARLGLSREDQVLAFRWVTEASELREEERRVLGEQLRRLSSL